VRADFPENDPSRESGVAIHHALDSANQDELVPLAANKRTRQARAMIRSEVEAAICILGAALKGRPSQARNETFIVGT
jgi:hypothetical protein